jgi:hypothetical protein
VGRFVEVCSSGLDEYLQGVSSDPLGGYSAAGLRVPTLATSSRLSRYLFMGAAFSMGEGARAKIRGFRQMVTIGKQTATSPSARFVELDVTSPMFRLPDANVSFHLKRLGRVDAQGMPNPASNITDLQSLKHNWAINPCLLYSQYAIPAGDKTYTHLTSYTPPSEGRPWGDDVGHLGNFIDLKTPWRTQGAWNDSLNIDVEGPCTIACFISVRQSAGAYAPLVGAPACTPEEQFVAAFPGSILWRVGAALVFEVL